MTCLSPPYTSGVNGVAAKFNETEEINDLSSDVEKKTLLSGGLDIQIRLETRSFTPCF